MTTNFTKFSAKTLVVTRHNQAPQGPWLLKPWPETLQTNTAGKHNWRTRLEIRGLFSLVPSRLASSFRKRSKTGRIARQRNLDAWAATYTRKERLHVCCIPQQYTTKHHNTPKSYFIRPEGKYFITRQAHTPPCRKNTSKPDTRAQRTNHPRNADKRYAYRGVRVRVPIGLPRGYRPLSIKGYGRTYQPKTHAQRTQSTHEHFTGGAIAPGQLFHFAFSPASLRTPPTRPMRAWRVCDPVTLQYAALRGRFNSGRQLFDHSTKTNSFVLRALSESIRNLLQGIFGLAIHHILRGSSNYRPFLSFSRLQSLSAYLLASCWLSLVVRLG